LHSVVIIYIQPHYPHPSASASIRPHRLFFTWGCVPHRLRVYPFRGTPHVYYILHKNLKFLYQLSSHTGFSLLPWNFGSFKKRIRWLTSSPPVRLHVSLTPNFYKTLFIELPKSHGCNENSVCEEGWPDNFKLYYITILSCGVPRKG